MSSGVAAILTPASNQTTQRGSPRLNFIEALSNAQKSSGRSPSFVGKSREVVKNNDSREIKELMKFQIIPTERKINLTRPVSVNEVTEDMQSKLAEKMLENDNFRK